MFGMFKKGGGDKAKQNPAVPPPENKNIEFEKTLHNINKSRDEIQDNLDRIDQKVSSLDQEIRSLASQKKMQQAKGKIAEMKGYQKQIETLQTKYNALTQMKIQIETLAQDAEIAKTFTMAADLAKQQQKTTEQLQDAMLDWNELQQNQQETAELWKQMAEMGVDQEEINDEYAKYEQEATSQQADKIQQQFAQVPKQPIIQQPQTITNQKPISQLDSQLNQLLD